MRFPSSVALPDQNKQNLVGHLNTVLATMLDLQSQLKQAHWNTKGPHFHARHDLFDKLALNQRELADDIAERVATLGGYAEGTVRLAAKQSELPEYDLQATDGLPHIRALVDRFATTTALLRKNIEFAEEQKDPATVDLLTAALRASEFDMWFLESHVAV